MKRFWGFLFVLSFLSYAACHDDDSDSTGKPGEGPGEIKLAVSGRIGTLTGESLTDYVKSLDVLLFRENANGIYLLTENATFNKAQLEDLLSGETESNAGFTVAKTVDFDNLPIGNYIVVGVGNMRDSTGALLENATLSDVNVGNTMDQVIASVTAGSVSPRLFFGQTERIILGSDMPATPRLTLYRKVAMFDLTLENVPAAVRRIDVEIENTYGAFNMTGAFLASPVISVSASDTYYFTEEQPVLPFTVILLPTVAGGQSSVNLNFYLENGQVINIPLQNRYVFKPNTITKLTATIDANQSGGTWNIELTLSISADVEWNVDQEPGIII